MLWGILALPGFYWVIICTLIGISIEDARAWAHEQGLWFPFPRTKNIKTAMLELRTPTGPGHYYITSLVGQSESNRYILKRGESKYAYGVASVHDAHDMEELKRARDTYNAL